MRGLTARQRQVLLLAAAGHTSEQAGRQLGIHRATVDRHLGETYRLLDARDRTHAVVLAIYHGHITLADITAIAANQTQEHAA
ncbi:helix-turn-helix transcriptional regulator [Streptomyces tuirus]|uniref:Helix-turn-helix transcriptional regulator n=1 Tax=Streptomyces tuirus TaxID=68278 RepID=A0A941F9F5_9ACTN|nr:helix-turn-helix transcriptional regulator [Streptomyces tuirus]